MNSSIRILGIAPYEGMQTSMLSLSAEYPQIVLDTFVGDLDHGAEIARRNFHENYDIVISRGATAHMLQAMNLPVIEVEISTYDILCALHLANGKKGSTAIVSFADISDSVNQLCKLPEYDIDIYITTPETVNETLEIICGKKYQTILCDMAVNTIARRKGLNSFLITSGIDSIRRAFNEALLLFQNLQHLKDENSFFRELIRGQISQTLVFDADGRILLSTIAHLPSGLEDVLRKEASVNWSEGRRLMRNIDGTLYTIQGCRISSNNAKKYVAFFFTARKDPMSSGKHGIRFSTCEEIEAELSKNSFLLTGIIDNLQIKLDKILHSFSPLIICGEDGVGKTTLVHMIYTKSSLQNRPLVTINCRLLKEKSWSYILENYKSPLAGQDLTLFFDNIDALPKSKQHLLLESLVEMSVCSRSRVIFSCQCQPDEYISEAGSFFLDHLYCIPVYLPPLRRIKAQIPSLINLILNHINVDLPRQILGITPQAAKLLQNYSWNRNYLQFQRILQELAVTATSSIIEEFDVRRLLSNEHHSAIPSPHSENVTAPIDLNKSLSEINRDIAIRVVAETNGNQTAAAKRLGISRTTLWRLLQNH